MICHELVTADVLFIYHFTIINNYQGSSEKFDVVADVASLVTCHNMLMIEVLSNGWLPSCQLNYNSHTADLWNGTIEGVYFTLCDLGRLFDITFGF